LKVWTVLSSYMTCNKTHLKKSIYRNNIPTAPRPCRSSYTNGYNLTSAKVRKTPCGR